MKVAFDKICCYFKSALAILVNVTYFLATKDGVGEAFYKNLF